MDYPIGEKPILKEPYYSFYSIFKAQPWNTLVVIGYSFRDNPVNVAFIDNLEINPKSKLILINPDPKKALSNLGMHVLRKFEDRIIPIKGEYGDARAQYI